MVSTVSSTGHATTLTGGDGITDPISGKLRDVVVDHQDNHNAFHHLHGHPKVHPWQANDILRA